MTSAGQEGLGSAVLLTSRGLPRVLGLCCSLALCFCGVKLENSHWVWFYSMLEGGGWWHWEGGFAGPFTLGQLGITTSASNSSSSRYFLLYLLITSYISPTVTIIGFYFSLGSIFVSGVHRAGIILAHLPAIILHCLSFFVMCQVTNITSVGFYNCI